MKFIAYIESPLQAFNLMEYIFYKNISLDILVVNKNSSVSARNYEQICFVLKFIESKNIILIDIKPSRKNVFSVRSLVRKLIIPSTESMTLISGEYRSMIFWFIVERFKNRNVVIVDDGTATLRLQRTHRTLNKIIIDKTLSFLGCRDRFLEPIVFFSVYDISKKINKKDFLIQHDYPAFKKRLSLLSECNDTIYIIGAPLLEAGVILGDDVEITLKMINKLNNKYHSKSLVYIPHRRERQEKINAISNVVTVRRLDYPFELLPLVDGLNIKNIAGFYSSLFDNMILICGKELCIDCFYLPNNIISIDWKVFVDSIYTNYKSYSGSSFYYDDVD